MSGNPAITIRLRGKEFRMRSGESPEALQRIAAYVDETMVRVEQRTGAVDSHDVALLTALNLAREVVESRELNVEQSAGPERLRALIELAESAVAGAG